MVLRFAVNLDRFWKDRPLAERFRLAAEHGFSEVEYLFPSPADVGVIDAAVAGSGVSLALFDVAVGDLAAGERGLLALPGREEEFLAAAERDLQLAARWRVPRVNVLAGRLGPHDDVRRALDAAVARLARLAPAAGEAGIVLLLEFISAQHAPGYALEDLRAAVEVVRRVGRDEVGLQLDQYHLELAGLDPVAVFDEHAELVRHVQVAHAPGRHEPDEGSTVHALLGRLEAAGYGEVVGLEYDPSTDEEAALSWLEAYRG